MKPWREMNEDEREEVVDSHLKGLKKKMMKSTALTISVEYDDLEYIKGGKYQRDIVREHITFSINYL